MNENRMEMIIPTILEDLLRTKRDLSLFFECLPVSEIIFIGPGDIKEYVEEEKKKYSGSGSISFIDENELLSKDKVFKVMKDRILADGYVMDGNSRPGWYYQQFLKMAYSGFCNKEYYMTWDADTIPLRKTEMFDKEEKPYFDIKPEFQRGYFITLKKLFNIDRQRNPSFQSIWYLTEII